MTTSASSNLHRLSPQPTRFLAFADLSPAEVEAIDGLSGEGIAFTRDQVIRHEGDAPDLFVLHRGWVASSAGFDDGSRQVVKVHLPGDILGVPSMGYTAAADTLTALTDVTVSRLAPEALASLFSNFPRLAMVCFLITQEERIILMERLMSVGRRLGPQRLAAFLLHIYDRLRVLDPCCRETFELPLTLDQLADVLGLHAVHVSRTLGGLERLGLIRRHHKRIELFDIDELRRLAGFPERTIVRNAPWLPSASPYDPRP